MKLQENIHRIQEIMGGVITEDNKSAKISKMIGDIGLSNTIKFFGGTKEFKELFKEYNISKEKKIDFIRQTVKEISYDVNQDDDLGFWTMDIDMSPIIYHKDENTLEQIELFRTDVVVIFMYEGPDYYKEVGEFKEYYEHLPDSILDKIIRFMLEKE